MTLIGMIVCLILWLVILPITGEPFSYELLFITIVVSGAFVSQYTTYASGFPLMRNRAPSDEPDRALQSWAERLHLDRDTIQQARATVQQYHTMNFSDDTRPVVERFQWHSMVALSRFFAVLSGTGAVALAFLAIVMGLILVESVQSGSGIIPLVGYGLILCIALFGTRWLWRSRRHILDLPPPPFCPEQEQHRPVIKILLSLSRIIWIGYASGVDRVLSGRYATYIAGSIYTRALLAVVLACSPLFLLVIAPVHASTLISTAAINFVLLWRFKILVERATIAQIGGRRATHDRAVPPDQVT